MSEKDEANLLAIVDALGKIQSFTAGFADADALYNDAKTFDATLMNFIVLGESVKRISQKFKDAHPEINWKKVAGFRDVVAHNYFGVDADEIWDLLQNHVSPLEKNIRKLLS